MPNKAIENLNGLSIYEGQVQQEERIDRIEAQITELIRLFKQMIELMKKNETKTRN